MIRLKIRMLDARHFGVEITSQEHSDYVYTLELVRAFPERKWSDALTCWKVPTTPTNIRYLKSSFRDDEVDCNADVKIVLEWTEMTEASATQREGRRWQYLFNGVVPDYQWKATGTNRKMVPFKHQIVAADAAIGQDWFAHLMEQGTGKTGVSIEEMMAVALKRKEEGKPALRVLVLCPKSLTSNWLNELELWRPEGLTLWSCRMRHKDNGLEDIVCGMRANADLKVWVCNYERVKSMIDGLIASEFDYCFADEASALKNPSAKRTKAAIALAESVDKRRILTGTIMANSIFDVFAPFQFLQRGCLGYETYQSFKDRYGQFAKTKDWEKLTGYKNLDELKERMAKFSFIVKKKDCLDLPEKSYQTIRVEMGEVQNDLYEQMADSFICGLDDTDLDNAMEAKAVIAQMVRFAQITSGFIVTPSGVHRIPDGDAKVDACLDIIEEATGKVIIWCRFRQDIEYLAAKLRENGIESVQIHGGVKDRDLSVTRFNTDDNVKVLIGEPGTGGMGLTLLGTKNEPCSTTIYYSQDWSLLKRAQSEDRNHRIGQKFPCTYYTLVCERTIDEAIDEAVMAKKNMSELLTSMGSIRDILLFGRKPKVERSADPVALRALLKEQGMTIPVDIGSTKNCEQFDHSDAKGNDNKHRCVYCSGDPMSVSDEALLAWYYNGQKNETESAA